MKLSINRLDLLQSVSTASLAIGRRIYKPALACLLLSATDDALNVTGTNLATSIRFKARQVEVERPGVCAVNADKLREIAARAEGVTLHLDSHDGVLSIRGDSATFEVPEFPAADLPPFQVETKGDPTVSMSSESLVCGLKMAGIATAEGTTRYAFNSINFEKNGKGMAMVATDSRRMAIYSSDAKCSGQFMLPEDVIVVLSKAASSIESEVQFWAKDNEVVVVAGDFAMRANLLEGLFAPWKDVIPKDCTKSAAVSRKALLACIDQAKILRGTVTDKDGKTEVTQTARFSFDANSVRIDVDGNNGKAGAKASWKYQGDPLVIGLNMTYLAEALQVSEDETVKIEATTASRPLLLTACNYQYVLMPCNLK